MLTSWEQQEPRLLYHRQLEITKSKARTVQREIERLQAVVRGEDAALLKDAEERHGCCASLGPEERRRLLGQKLEFLVAEMGVYTHIVKLVVSQAAKIDLEDIRRDLPSSRLEKQSDFFLEAFRILQLMEHAFEGVLLAPLDSFAWICGEFKRNLGKMVQQCPGQSTGTMPAAIATGGVVSVLSHTLASGACAIVVGAVAGTVVGLAALAGLWTVAENAFGDQENAAAKGVVPERRELQRMIERLEEQDLQPAALEELRDLFRRCFVKPAMLWGCPLPPPEAVAAAFHSMEEDPPEACGAHYMMI